MTCSFISNIRNILTRYIKKTIIEIVRKSCQVKNWYKWQIKKKVNSRLTFCWSKSQFSKNETCNFCIYLF